MSGEELWLRAVVDMAGWMESRRACRWGGGVDRAHPVECAEDRQNIISERPEYGHSICTARRDQSAGQCVNKSPKAARIDGRRNVD